MSADQVSDFVDVLKGLDPSVDVRLSAPTVSLVLIRCLQPYKYVQEQLQASMV